MPEEATQQIFKCFVIMPFSDTEHEHDGRQVRITAAQWSHVFTHWIQKAVESFPSYKFRCVRSPAQPGNFIKGIVQDLYDSDIVIADLTGGKANVYYELGIRHALETGTIMVTQDLGSVPSDLRGYYTFQYRYTSEHHEYEQSYADFERQLHEKIAYIFDNLNPSDNPVSDFLGHTNEYLRQTFEYERNELVLIAELFRDTVRHHFDLCETLLKTAETGDFPEDGVMLVFDFYPFDLLLSRLVNTRWQLVPMQMLQQFNGAVQTIRRMFLPVYQDWLIFRINPASEMNTSFLDILKAAVGTRADYDGMLDGIIEELRKLSYTITFTPRAESIRRRSKGETQPPSEN